MPDRLASGLLADRFSSRRAIRSSDLPTEAYAIETAFTLQDSVGVTHHLDPQYKPVRPGPGIDLLLQSVTGLAVEGLGSLTLTFGDSSLLAVHPHDQYESWELYGEGISGILAGPGGETGRTN